MKGSEAGSQCDPVRDAQITTLVVIAGVSCVGKSTLLKTVARLGSQTLPAALRLPVGASVAFLNDGGETQLYRGSTTTEIMMLHYDIFRPVARYGPLDFSVDPLLEVLNRADTIKVLTLWEEPEILRERARIRRAHLWGRLLRKPIVRRFPTHLSQFLTARRRRAMMAHWYADPSRLRDLYNVWFEFCHERNMTEHWVLEPTKGLEHSLMSALEFFQPPSQGKRFESSDERSDQSEIPHSQCLTSAPMGPNRAI